MAVEILRLRHQGRTHQDALANVSDKFGWSQTIIGEAWAKYQCYAISYLAIERPRNEYPWTQSEVDKLDEMFSNKSWYLKPGKPRPWEITPEK